MMAMQCVPLAKCYKSCKTTLIKREPINVYKDKFNSYWRHHNKSKATEDITEIKEYMQEFSCGVMNFNPATLIIGGHNVPYPAWPWHVLLCHMMTCCGGTLISDDLVVTAAHCSKFTKIVRAGVNNRFGEDQSREQRRKGDTLTVHENFNNTANNDIALVWLDSPLDVTGEFVRPACLPYEDVYDMHNCYFVGMGETGNVLRNKYKKQMKVTLVPLAICQMIMRMINYVQIDERSLCFLGVERNASACHGDSGGGVHCLHNGKWHLVGVASQARAGCDPRFPTIYVTVHWFTEWILQTALKYINLDYR